MKSTIRLGLSAILAIMLTLPVMAGEPGTLKWAFATGGKVSSSPALSKDGIIYVGSEDGKIYAINPDGSKKWEFPTEGAVSRSPVINDRGIIHISSADGKLYALNSDGTPKWSVELGDGDCALSRYQTIYLSVFKSIRNCFLYAIMPTGKWKLLDTVEEINGGPAIGPDGTIYLSGWGNYSGRIFAFNPYGTPKWDFSLGVAKVYNPAAVARDGTIYTASIWSYMVHAIDPAGLQKWGFTIDGYSSSPAIGVDGAIYVQVWRDGKYDNKIYAINPNGSEKWCFTKWDYNYGIKPYFVPSPALGADGTLYASMGGHDLLALNPEGSEKWVFSTGGWVRSSPVIGPDGTIYVGSDDGNLYAVYSDSPGLADSDWPMYQHDPQHTGSAQLPYHRPNLSPVIILLQD